jgi:hypothetical protein
MAYNTRFALSFLRRRDLEKPECSPAIARIDVAGFDQDPDVAREPAGPTDDNVRAG